MCQKRAFCRFWGKRKKKKQIWPNCEPIEVCKHSVKTCSNKRSCQILQPGLLLDVPLPTGPQEGTLSLPSPRDSGEKAAVPPRVLPAEPSPGASHSPEPLTGGWVRPTSTSKGLARDARAALELPCALPGVMGLSGTGTGVCFYPHL